eukprot:m.251558 g.251558  ORF g.251558 m.251558 type:complete len:385 (-) comp19111_c3_seq4:2853-4007(-)
MVHGVFSSSSSRERKSVVHEPLPMTATSARALHHLLVQQRLREVSDNERQFAAATNTAQGHPQHHHEEHRVKRRKVTLEEKLAELDRKEAAMKENLEALEQEKHSAFQKFRQLLAEEEAEKQRLLQREAEERERRAREGHGVTYEQKPPPGMHHRTSMLSDMRAHGYHQRPVRDPMPAQSPKLGPGSSAFVSRTPHSPGPAAGQRGTLNIPPPPSTPRSQQSAQASPRAIHGFQGGPKLPPPPPPPSGQQPLKQPMAQHTPQKSQQPLAAAQVPIAKQAQPAQGQSPQPTLQPAQGQGQGQGQQGQPLGQPSRSSMPRLPASRGRPLISIAGNRPPLGFRPRPPAFFGQPNQFGPHGGGPPRRGGMRGPPRGGMGGRAPYGRWN